MSKGTANGRRHTWLRGAGAVLLVWAGIHSALAQSPNPSAPGATPPAAAPGTPPPPPGYPVYNGVAIPPAAIDLGSLPWLHVEVIVFRQLDTSSAENESWPANPALSYPRQLEFLIDPATLPETDEPPVPKPVTASQSTPAAELLPVVHPYHLLAPEEMVMTQAVARMRGSASFRVLRHAAWRQPVPAGNQDINVLLTGGEAHGTHHELEGYLSLRRLQFMHAQARLWLNDFAAAEADPGTLKAGADLPEQPTPPPSETAASAPPRAMKATTSAAEAAAASDDAATLPLRTARSVLLSATRKVGLDEIHYFDHPLFGMILTLRPFDPEGLAVPMASSSSNAPLEAGGTQ